MIRIVLLQQSLITGYVQSFRKNTEIHAADHDYPGTDKIVPSVIVDFNIGKNPSESLLSGGVDGNGMIYVAVHDPFDGRCWEYRLKMYGFDDKASIKVVDDPGCHVAATT